MRENARNAFTLIELLIVVLIIAILAAIAVPNFLEFQTRAKISRVKTDMRTMATAIEAYRIDNNEYPVGARALGIADPAYAGLTSGERSIIAQRYLTTPIAYISTMYLDVFRDTAPQTGSSSGLTKGSVYIYHSFEPPAPAAWNEMVEVGYYWSIHSLGPARENAVGGNITELLDGSGWIKVKHLTPYDPTNGTVSFGQLCRTNKGEFTEPLK